MEDFLKLRRGRLTWYGTGLLYNGLQISCVLTDLWVQKPFSTINDVA